MMFKQLQDMALFALVAECGSFTAAANRAGLPKSSVSQRVGQLELALGLRLINRTTRQLNLTFAGERYLVHCQEMLQASERAATAIERLRDNPSGRLRITSPAGIGATLLARLNTAFQQEYPDVTLDVSVSDEICDLVQGGYDVALRTGRPQDSSLIGRRIGYCERLLVASPDYLAAHPPLAHPGQLSEHRSIAHRAWNEWVLKRGEEYYRWLLPPAHVTDNLVYARECALGNAGITLLPRFLTEDGLLQGRLLRVLPEWEMEGNELWLVYPGRKLNSPALMRFIDFAIQSPIFREFYT
ncbi:MAG TPA: LysR family transcriptional regulator [Erwinia persicina]|uniref:LysR family transcriptional regulator n=1 Tax=Erwinia persicina TaxID=55211 RepID=A0A3S7S6T1_9GAMM|nr:LysR family transcriptional regulator [Erwinia persicina]AXU96467.1 LysR family transcriptional regulator [Erwinia persicina]MBC3944553.1 LysR family transcriptional regulator [Erwinia persicina]MBD8106051.1 LysR family transcriptional regulator [Erwinia persicina]MBD8168238.1 LysR family transcriptional regulator [Erwinia persicina]MBD8208806.1 LysR family transcriptional regulator [Erwinia persicina]